MDLSPPMGLGCRRSSLSLMMSGIGGVEGGRGELVLGGPIGVGDGPDGPSEIIIILLGLNLSCR